MSTFMDREITSATSPVVVIDFLQSVFITELLRPSRCLWISSPWISNVEIVDNRARQFGSLCPDWPVAPIRLIRLLETLLERGGKIVIITNDAPHNEEFLSQLRPLSRGYPENLRVIKSPDLHEKGIVGDWFSLTGSMNLTYRGVYVNQEHVVYTCDPARVSERRLGFESRWAKAK